MIELDAHPETLEMVPPPSREELIGEQYDEIEQEPNFDILIRARRTRDGKGVPCSELRYAYTLEGILRAPMSQRNRDYIATMLRHIAWLIQDQPATNMTGDERMAAVARRKQETLRADLNVLTDIVTHLVKEHDVHYAATVLRMKEYKVRQLVKTRGPLPASKHRQPRLTQVAR